jgi:hypothetical protein
MTYTQTNVKSREALINNETLLALLKATKQSNHHLEWDEIYLLLNEIYLNDLNLMQCFNVVTNAYTDAVQEPAFQIHYTGNPGEQLQKLLHEPLYGIYGVKGPVNELYLSDTVIVKDIYNSFIKHMLSALRLSNIGWCKDIIEDYKLNEKYVEFVDSKINQNTTI